jgi:hypothetical protein
MKTAMYWYSVVRKDTACGQERTGVRNGWASACQDDTWQGRPARLAVD